MSAFKQQRRRRRWLLELAFSSRPSVHMFASRSVCVWFMIMLAFFNCYCLKARSCSDVQTLALCFVCNGVATFCFRGFPKTPFLLYVNLKRLVFLVVIGVILFVWLECSIVRPFACLSVRPTVCLISIQSIWNVFLFSILCLKELRRFFDLCLFECVVTAVNVLQDTCHRGWLTVVSGGHFYF